MKKFIVEDRVFEILPEYCLGAVVARGIDNRSENARIAQMLRANVAAAAEACSDANVKELPNVRAYREAFSALSMNPNRHMCSIEALMKRVKKGGELPQINPVVDLGNALSVKYQLPLGAHDIDRMDADFEVRFSTAQDSFLPLGETETEMMEAGELVYVSGHTVKTRRWIWRQSEDGKITEDTANVFFPIDGFANVNREALLAARDELAAFLRDELGCEVRTGFLDRETNEFPLE